MIGRKNEFIKLTEHLNSQKFESILVYGRRRVGKTYLINEALKTLKKTRIIKYAFRDVATSVNIREFSFFVTKLLDGMSYELGDIESILNYISIKTKKKFVLFLDEYSFLRRKDNGIDSYFQRFIDDNVDEKGIKIIFAGSYMDIMESLIEREAPLYGRMNLILKLRTFNYFESSLFLSDKLNSEEKFKFYATFGGLGFALKNIDNSKNFKQNLIELFLSKDSLFEKEITNILNIEFSKDVNVKYLLELIGNGTHKYKDLENEFIRNGISNNISYLLNKLIDLDLIKKEEHINKNKNNSYYYIKDNMFDFYFTFISKNENIRESLTDNDFYEFILKKIENEYLPRKFEDVSKEFLLLLNKNGNGPFFYEIGSLTYNDPINKKNSQFDIVTKKEDYLIDYECKYYSRLLNFDDYKKEEEQVLKTSIVFNEIRFISKEGVDDTFPKNIINYKLEDFYNF